MENNYACPAVAARLERRRRGIGSDRHARGRSDHDRNGNSHNSIPFRRPRYRFSPRRSCFTVFSEQRRLEVPILSLYTGNMDTRLFPLV